jgi:hypothetical protein
MVGWFQARATVGAWIGRDNIPASRVDEQVLIARTCLSLAVVMPFVAALLWQFREAPLKESPLPVVGDLLDNLRLIQNAYVIRLAFSLVWSLAFAVLVAFLIPLLWALTG